MKLDSGGTFPAIKPSVAVEVVVRFAVVYLGCCAIWPVVRSGFEGLFCTVASVAYNLPVGFWEVEFEKGEGTNSRDRLRAVVVNPGMMKADGSGPVRNVDIDIEAFGWRPLALISALAVAVPFPRRRRMATWTIASGSAVVLSVLLFGLLLWSDSREIGLYPGAIGEAAAREFALKLWPVAMPLALWGVAVTLGRTDE